MEPLLKRYTERLDALKKEIQDSDLLKTYLETEEEEDYRALRDQFEPAFDDIYAEVATDFPMQLITLENELMDDDFEGIHLPKVLGFSILRGSVNEDYRYIRPQEQFEKTLMAIINSSNFDYLKLRIGQSVQVGFALSSDIWITNLIESVPSKRVRQFLEGQKNIRLRDQNQRRIAYLKYKKQFDNYFYYTAEWPETRRDMSVMYPELKDFLVQRIRHELNEDNLQLYIKSFAENKDIRNSRKHTFISGLIANYIPLSDTTAKEYSKMMNTCRKDDDLFTPQYFNFLDELLKSDMKVDANCHKRVSNLIDHSIEDDMSTYYDLMDTIELNGWTSETAVDATRDFYYQHQGLSVINECVRLTIFKLFENVLVHLSDEEYPELFELYRYLAPYIQIFSNEQFNIAVKNGSLKYLKPLTTKVFTDKRGKDYQEIRKFLNSTMVDLGFMTEKEVKEFLKTKRKPVKKVEQD